MKKLFSLGLILIVISLPFWGMLTSGFHNIQDSMQFFRVYEMKKCLDDLQIPCRWVPDMGYQYGYPLYLFYAPGPYYLGVTFYSLGVSLINSVRLLFILGFVGSFVTMYLFLKSFLPRAPALTGAILYLYLPVRAVQVYVRGSLTESLAFVIFPLLFLFARQVLLWGRKKDVIYLAVSVFLLLVTHNLMSLMFFPVMVFWIGLITYLHHRYSHIKKVIVAGIWGVGLASFFVLPLIVERNNVHIESLTGGYFGYQQHFVSLSQLFLSHNFGYGSSQIGPGDDLSLSLGLPWLISLAGVVGAVVWFKRNTQRSVLFIALTVLSLATIFLMHEKSAFIWEKVKVLAWLQFPWRWLVVSGFLLTILSAMTISLLKSRKLQFTAGVIVVLAVVGLYGPWFKPQKQIYLSDTQILSGQEYERQLTSSIFDYLPKSAELPPNQKAGYLPEVLEGEVEVSQYIKGSNYQQGEVNVLSPQARLRVPLYDFPGMRVRVDGQDVGHSHDDCSGQAYCFGLISFSMPSGQHRIAINLENTPVRTAGDIITLFSWMGLGLALFRPVFIQHTHA